MKQFQVFHLVILMSLTTASTAAPEYGKRGCKVLCGDVKIPYPFGIGVNCSINKWYAIDCKSSTPYLSALNNLEVLGVDLGNQTVTVNISMISDCQNPVRNSSQILSLDLTGSPFVFSNYRNIFVVQGCGNAIMLDRGSVLTGCSASCGNETVSETKNCFGIICCQARIPRYFQSYSVDVRGLERQGRDGACDSAFVVDENSYCQGRFPSNSFVPISLLWTLTDQDMEEVGCDSSRPTRLKLDLGNSTSVESRKCSCWITYEGNPYLRQDCQVSEECRRCRQTGRYCDYNPVYDGNMNRIPNNSCITYPDDRSHSGRKSPSSSLGLILGNLFSHLTIHYTPVLGGVFIFVLASYWRTQ